MPTEKYVTGRILVCAAGQSRRFGGNKLLYPIDGTPMLTKTLNNIHLGTQQVATVILSPDDTQAHELVTKSQHQALILETPSTGLGISIASAVARSDNNVGWLICLADMPYIPPEVYAKVWQHQNLQKIVAPYAENRRGHPVFFPARFREALLQLHEDKGAAKVIQQNPEHELRIPVNTKSIFWDIDERDQVNNTATQHIDD